MRTSRLVLVLVAVAALACSAVVTASPTLAVRSVHGRTHAHIRAHIRARVTVRHVSGGHLTHLRRGSVGRIRPSFEPEAVQKPVTSHSGAAAGQGLSGIRARNTPVVRAQRVRSFSGLDHHQQALEVGPGQFELEPPDQALCVGNGYVVEAVNTAVAVYRTNGTRLAMDSLNHFFGYPPEFDEQTGDVGPKQPTDPSCLFDPSTGRFFLTMLTVDSDTQGNPTGPNTLDTAVSSTGNPLGAWTISHVQVIDDGTLGTPNHPGCPCLGDYPRIGVDATGYYISTNEYPWATNGFVGAQLYAMAKSQLASGASTVRVTQVDTAGLDPHGNPGFTVWPAQSPGTGGYSTAAGGTEYFLSTDAAEEANGSGRSRELLTWALTGTSSLAPSRSPDLHLQVVASRVGEYAVPRPARQKSGPVPLATCLNLPHCASIVLGQPDRSHEQEARLDSLDSRMQQVTYAGGMLYGAHGTAVDVRSRHRPLRQQTGAAWYITRPVVASDGSLSTTVLHQGRLATAGNNVLMPALGARANGSAVIGMTLAGRDHYPGQAYVGLTARGTTSRIRVIAEGVGPEDGFAGYRAFGGEPRWGDYGAAAVDSRGGLWVANEWIGQRCTYQQYTATPFGECGGTRTTFANWSTRISRVPRR